ERGHSRGCGERHRVPRLGARPLHHGSRADRHRRHESLHILRREGEGTMPIVKETFDAMEGRFKADKAAGTNATIQYDVSGEGGGTWNAVIKDGTCKVSQGAAATPNLTLQIAAQDWLDMLSGKQSG